jgi:hypothetical protein
MLLIRSEAIGAVTLQTVTGASNLCVIAGHAIVSGLFEVQPFAGEKTRNQVGKALVNFDS